MRRLSPWLVAALALGAEAAEHRDLAGFAGFAELADASHVTDFANLSVARRTGALLLLGHEPWRMECIFV